jgi:hypothetical protein
MAAGRKYFLHHDGGRQRLLASQVAAFRSLPCRRGVPIRETSSREKLGAALGHDVSHGSAHVLEVKQEQPIAPQREIGPRQEQGLGFGISM